MPLVTVSPKFQIVIPREVRESLGILPGEKVQVFQYENRIEYIPVRSIKKLRGFLRGMSTDLKRDADCL